MCASKECRKNKNIWWHLFSMNDINEWRGKQIFNKKWWKTGKEYIFHDSIGKFWYRWVACRIFGHKNLQIIGCPEEYERYGQEPLLYCFDCEQYYNKQE